ncbi:MAG: protein disulfide oxidoreductase [Gammaproteobacteria bacterium]|nr:protein disulfide oxidoreductase [Gammaproteobacteria bacterium]
MNKAETTPRSWNKRLLSWLVQLSILLLIILAVEAFLTRSAVGMMAPSIDAATINQEAFSLQQFKGKPAIVHFWATWCPVCKLEQGMLNSIAADVPIITVAMQSGTADEVLNYHEQHDVTYPVINDPNGLISNQYGIQGVPASFIIDGEGQVRFATHGYTTGLGLRVRLWLAGLF